MTEEALDPAAQPAEEGSTEERTRPRRRRRRGGRGRRRSGSTGPKTAESSQAEEKTSEKHAKEPAAEAPSEDGGETTQKSTAARRRRRRRRKPSGATGPAGDGPTTEAVAEDRADAAAQLAAAEPAPDGEKAPARRRRSKSQSQQKSQTQQKPQTQKKSQQKPQTQQKRQGSTRAAPTRTSRTARRTATDRRRRQPVLHAPRRTDKRMLITEHHDRLQIVVVEGQELVEHYVARSGASSMVGNIYLGKVQNVLPGMEAAFIDVGRGRNAVLYAGEVSYDEEVERDERRIESVLKQGQSVLVQVSKDPLRGKGARLTAQISVPGRFLVYVPDSQVWGISRRLPDDERERLRRIMKKLRPSEAGVIVRTAAEGASEEDLEADLERLKKTWESIKRKSKRGKVPRVLHEEPDLAERVVRDVFSPAEFQEIVIDSPAVYDQVTAYLRDVAPELLDRVRKHDGPLSLFDAHHVSEQIHKALERKVWLPSGGYVVIDRVEAMSVIDVNTGKHVGKTNLEQTVTTTNLEAAREIARQLRLRDIGGIIVIDFIDMMLQTNREDVIQTLKEELAHDKTRSQVFEITPLGLLEMTRKKVSAGLLEAFSEPCPTCEGRGILITHDA